MGDLSVKQGLTQIYEVLFTCVCYLNHVVLHTALTP